MKKAICVLMLVLGLMISETTFGYSYDRKITSKEIESVVMNILDQGDYEEVEISKKWKKIELYDIELSQFANLIPLEKENELFAYIVIGSRLGTPYFLVLSEDTQEYLALLEIEGNGGKIGYIPLGNFYVMDKGDIKGIKKNSKQLTTSERLEFKEHMTMVYSSINNMDKEYSMKNYIVKNLKKKGMFTDVHALQVVWKERLINWSDGDFVPIAAGVIEGTTYGGNQAWYNTSYKRGNGCGPVAATNIVYYLAKQKNDISYDPLYTGSSAKSSFLSAMDNMYQSMQPGVLGTWRNSFKQGMDSYALIRGVDLDFSEYVINSSSTYSGALAFLKSSMAMDYPVAMLNTALSAGIYEGTGGDIMDKHWLTLTSIALYDDAVVRMYVSSYGKQYWLDYGIWYDLSDNNQVVYSSLIRPY